MNDLYFTAQNKKACKSNHFRRKCISSVPKRVYLAFGRVYHQVAERYTLMRDDIQPKGLMIFTTLRAVMIYQVCDLDKKILQKMYPFLQYFSERDYMDAALRTS